jgi:subtilisin family serine protease
MRQLTELFGSPRHILRRSLSVWVLSATLLVLSPSSLLEAQERVVVRRGKEIVVSYSPRRNSSAVGAYAVRHLRLPDGLKVREVMSHGSIAVVSSVSTVNALSAGKVEVDMEDVARECARIHAANRGLPIHCEANLVRTASRLPNDPGLGNLYGLTRMNASNAWDITTGSPSVTVAVIDTGVEYNHADLQDNIIVNTGETPGNGIDDDTNGYVDDYFGYDFYSEDGNPADEHGHGTHCAGIVGARGDNGRGVVGITWNVGILPVRVLGADGSGSDADVAAGMYYAIARGASVLSLSLGGPFFSAVLDDAVQYARDRGVLVVAAAGNDYGQNLDVEPAYPASLSYDNMVAVAATDPSDGLAYFSNYGPSSVHVAAPGQGILSTYLGGQFAYMSGTSMATPYVAGVAALMKSAKPSLGYMDIKSGLIAASDPIDALQGKVVANGRVNAYRAVMTALSAEISPVPTAQPTATPNVEPTSEPTPQPTPEPTPIALPGKPSTRAVLSITSKRYGQRIIISGRIRDTARKPVSQMIIGLRCQVAASRRVRSDNDGFYAFRLAARRRVDRCFVKDEFDNRSRRVVVR